MLASLIIAAVSGQFAVDPFRAAPVNDMIHASSLNALPRSMRGMREKVCGVPCQRFPKLVKRQRLINILAQTMEVDVSCIFVSRAEFYNFTKPTTLDLIGPAKLIGRKFVDVGQCMGNCAR